MHFLFPVIVEEWARLLKDEVPVDETNNKPRNRRCSLEEEDEEDRRRWRRRRKKQEQKNLSEKSNSFNELVQKT